MIPGSSRRLMLDRRFFLHSAKIRESNQLSARFLSSSSPSSSSDIDLGVDVEEQQKEKQRVPFQRPLENGLELGVFKAILVGKVGQKPVQKVLKSGRPVTLFSLGTGGIRNNRRPLDDEDPREYANRCAVQWHRVAVYPEKLGNVALKNVKPGAVVYVEGNLETKIFSDPISGLVRRIREVAVRRDGRLVFVTGDPDNNHSTEADLKGISGSFPIRAHEDDFFFTVASISLHSAPGGAANSPAAPPLISRVSRRIFTVGGGALLPFLAAPPPIAAAEPLTTDEITQRAFLDVSVDGEPAGRIIIGLYGAAVPGGAARFASLVSGAPGSTYRRKPFTKIMPGYIQHGGVPGGAASDDLVKEWEATEERRRRRGSAAAAAEVGILVRDPALPPAKTKIVAKKGKLVVEEEEVGARPNGTEFVIVVKESPELDERALVVGRVVEGMEVAERIAGLDTVKENSSSPYFRVAKLIGDKRAVVAARGFNRPYSKIIVTNCGLLP